MVVDEVLREELAKQTVFANRDFLSPSYIPSHMPFREGQLEKVTRTLAPALKGKKPNNIFLYGKTGTGKSSVARSVADKILEYSKREHSVVFRAYMNCKSSHNTKYQILANIAQELNPDERLQGFAVSYLYNKIKASVSQSGAQLIVILDEVDRIKDLDDTIYTLTRMNDELEQGALTVVGISNKLDFKEELDVRTKSTLCQEEHIFPPYNAEELTQILRERVGMGFKEGAVSEGAINLAAARAAQESGDARKALMLISRAGDIADEHSKNQVTEGEVETAQSRVEEDLILGMVESLPRQQQFLLYAVLLLTVSNKGVRRLGGEQEKGQLFSGEVYDKYCEVCKGFGKKPSTDRWYREQLRELATYGLIEARASGPGIRGNTQLVSLNADSAKMKLVLERKLGAIE